MPRPKKLAPDYRYHMSGQAVVTFNGKNFYLGPHGTPESEAKYRKLVAEYIASGGETPGAEIHQAEAVVTVSHVTAEARVWVEQRYAFNPTQKGRFLNLCQLLDDEYGSLPADQFGPRKLAELRDLFVASGNCRKYTNQQTRNVVRIFKYALSRELIQADTLVKLQSLEPLRFGQTTAKESEPVQPVDLEHVKATAKHLSPTVRAMIRIQAATGMRPGEVCNMRPCDIDRSGPEWLYKPASHKTKHKGKSKVVPILGDAREALTPFLLRPAESYCFSPAESTEWHRAKRRAARTTPLSCGTKPGDKQTENAKRAPSEKYNKDSYRRAVERAAKAAKVPHWFPYQLRHTAGTIVREALGIEAAQALLGHSRASMTEHYAKQSEKKAIEAAKFAPAIG